MKESYKKFSRKPLDTTERCGGLLNEYRCACGKLLFKGVMLVAVVEVKCKRCGKTILFNGSPRGAMCGVSFILLIDMNGMVIDACEVAPVALAYSRSQLIGSPIVDICPLLCDGDTKKEMHASLHGGKSYSIKENIFLVRDGSELPAESYCIGANRDNMLTSYRMFNWAGKALEKSG